jgi:hypothetical protein
MTYDDDELDGTACILCTMAEVNRLRRIEAAARYLRNSNAWVGDTDDINAMLAELDAALKEEP